MSPHFLDEVSKKYHYKEEDSKLLESVARDIRGCIKDQEGLEFLIFETYADAAFTMGANLDILLEKYSAAGQLIKQLMLENICSLLLMEAYSNLTELLEHETGRYVGKFHFWGSEEAYPLEKLPEVVAKFTSLRLFCTPDYCLRPSKSVVCRLELSPKAAHKSTNVLKGICGECTYGKSGRCEQCMPDGEQKLVEETNVPNTYRT